MISLSHAALWVQNLDGMKAFYERYFKATCGPRYNNPAKGFSSYFLSFDSGARLELMSRASSAPDPLVDLPVSGASAPERYGYAHLAFSVGDEPTVDALTRRVEGDGFAVLSGPRRTGDGYYESVIADPEGNRIEITV